MSNLSVNSHDYYCLTKERDKYTRNSKKYYACTQLIKINKLERKLILEEQTLRTLQERFDERVRRFKISQKTKRQIIEALQEDVASLRK
jgi:hypothetical protein